MRLKPVSKIQRKLIWLVICSIVISSVGPLALAREGQAMPARSKRRVAHHARAAPAEQW